MIQLTVKKSNDINKLGTVIFNKNLIYVGNDHLCDLYIIEEGLLANHLIIEIAEGNLIAHPNKKIDYFHVNGKRSTGHKILTVGNLVKIGNTEFTIDNFVETQYKTIKEELNQITDKLIQDESKLLDIIQEIQGAD